MSGCSCSCPTYPTEGVPAMASVSAEDFARIQEGGERFCLATALSLSAGVPAALEPVVLPADCNQITVSFVVTSATSTPQGIIYLLEAIDCGSTWTVTGSGNFSAIGHAVLSPPLTGVGSRCFKVVVIGQFGTIVICDVCIWCSNT